MRATTTTALVALVLVGGVAHANWSGFKGIPGKYCETRSGPKCCVSRDDDCTADILGNHKCYCDKFCHRPDEEMHGDCCPDYLQTCEGAPPPVQGVCEDDGGRMREVGERARVNCNDCTCTAGGWQCQPDNKCLIEKDLLSLVNGGRSSWRAHNYSMFWGRTLTDGIKYRLGTLYPDSSVQNMHGILAPEVELVDEFDARQKWPDYISPVRDQGDCGSSWAFSTISLAEDRLAILSEGKLKQQLSPQQLLSCNQASQRGCDGGYLDRAWWFIRWAGVVSEQCYPYRSGQTREPGTCQVTRQDMARKDMFDRCPAGGSSKVYQITPSYRLASNEADIRKEIIMNGPVQATFRVYEDFYMYQSGVYQRSSNIPANSDPSLSNYHSVRIIGFGIDRSTGRDIPYWLCANSWGTSWGEQGLFKIIRGENHCEIESFVISALGQGAKKRRRRLLRKLKRQRVLKLR